MNNVLNWWKNVEYVHYELYSSVCCLEYKRAKQLRCSYFLTIHALVQQSSVSFPSPLCAIPNAQPACLSSNCREDTWWNDRQTRFSPIRSRVWVVYKSSHGEGRIDIEVSFKGNHFHVADITQIRHDSENVTGSTIRKETHNPDPGFFQVNTNN